MSNVNMVEKKSLKLGNKALLVVKGHGIHPKGLAQKLRMKKRLRFSGSHRKERVIKLPDACLPCNKLYWIYCYWGWLQVEDTNHLYFSFSRNSSTCLVVLHSAAPNHAILQIVVRLNKTRTTCWADRCRHALMGLAWDVLMSWITCWMSIVISWWKLKTRSLPGLIKQPAQSPLLTSNRFKGKAHLSTASLQVITLTCKVVWGCKSHAFVRSPLLDLTVLLNLEGLGEEE